MYLIKYLMQEAKQLIKNILTETYEEHGWAIPYPVTEYQVSILASMVDRMPWIPEPSYAERYLSIKSAADAMQLGDVCFFTRAVFPELGSRRGINSSYYVQLGEGCYDRVLTYSAIPAVKVMRDHFEFLAECVYTAIRLNGEFRSMWE